MQRIISAADILFADIEMILCGAAERPAGRRICPAAVRFKSGIPQQILTGFAGFRRNSPAAVSVDIAEYIKRIERLAVRRKERLILPAGAAEILCVGIVFLRRFICPAAAVLLPELHGSAVIAADGQPRRLPVEHADAHAVRDGCDRAEQIVEVGCLSLCADRIFHIAAEVFLAADRIDAGIVIFHGICPRGLRDECFFAVCCGDIAEHGSQILQRAVPVGIVGCCEYVIIHMILMHHFRKILHIGSLFGIRKMQRDEHIRIVFADGFCTGVPELCKVAPDAVAPVPVGEQHAAHAGGCLVADLHHCDLRAGFAKLFQCLRSIAVDRVRLLLYAVGSPCLRGFLLCGIRPEIGVVEIDKQLQSGSGTALCDRLGMRGIIRAAAVGDAGVRGGRIIPDAHADAVDAGICERDKDILFFAAAVIEFHAALLQRDDG